MGAEREEQLGFGEDPAIIAALDERGQLRLLYSFLTAQARDVHNRIVEIDAYVGDKERMFNKYINGEEPAIDSEPIEPTPYQPRVGSAKRIAGHITHILGGHSQMSFPTGLRKMLK